MKKLTFTVIFVGLAASFANAERAEAVESSSEGAPEKICQRYLQSVLESDAKSLTQCLADHVILLVGHEFLNPRYGLATDSNRGKSTTVKRDDFLSVVKNSTRARGHSDVEKLLTSLKYEEIEVTPGVVKLPDPVSSHDGKVHISVKKGDRLFKVTLPKSDHSHPIGGDFRAI